MKILELFTASVTFAAAQAGKELIYSPNYSWVSSCFTHLVSGENGIILITDYEL